MSRGLLERTRPVRATALVAALALAACGDALVHEERSAWSHIRVRRDGDVRILRFVRDTCEEVTESMVDLSEPHRLVLPYTRPMFANYLFYPDPERVLIVGLGGGAMVHFLEHHDPELQVEAVEIDPAVVRVADEHFDVRSRGNTTIVTADGFDHIRDTPHRYDAIYLDAFLKPSEETDATGVPQTLKTEAFYATLQDRLTDDGVVVFNLNLHSETEADVETIAASFPHVVELPVARTNNLVVVGCTKGAWAAPEVLAERARQLDERFDVGFSFAAIWEGRRSP